MQSARLPFQMQPLHLLMLHTHSKVHLSIPWAKPSVRAWVLYTFHFLHHQPLLQWTESQTVFHFWVKLSHTLIGPLSHWQVGESPRAYVPSTLWISSYGERSSWIQGQGHVPGGTQHAFTQQTFTKCSKTGNDVHKQTKSLPSWNLLSSGGDRYYTSEEIAV